MPYGPHAADDRARMLEAIGIDSVDALFEDIPAGLRAGPLALDEPEPELLLTSRLQAMAARNRVDLASFLGAGAYRHWTPAVVDQMLLRGEWYTAYTPYQPEVSQGTLQSIYEYQSLLAELTGLDVVSASHYDGGAATAEAALMTCRATQARADPRLAGRPSALPGDAGDLRGGRGPGRRRGPDRRRRARWRAPRTSRHSSASWPSPGAPSPASSRPSPTSWASSRTCPRSDASRTPRAPCSWRSSSPSRSPSSRRPPSTAPTSPPARASRWASRCGYGGPYLGIVACTDPLIRQIPGRLVGMTADLDGRRAFVMTMRAREQDIRREKAASNICTNQALLALAASIYLSAIGPHGLRDVAATGAARAAELVAALEAAGAPRLHEAPYLNEFVVRVPDARAVHARLLERGILAGIPTADLLPDEPSLADGLLVCATEVTTSDEIARFAAALAAELAAADAGGAA